jgi:hypothetical protein
MLGAAVVSVGDYGALIPAISESGFTRVALERLAERPLAESRDDAPLLPPGDHDAVTPNTSPTAVSIHAVVDGIDAARRVPLGTRSVRARLRLPPGSYEVLEFTDRGPRALRRLRITRDGQTITTSAVERSMELGGLDAGRVPSDLLAAGQPLRVQRQWITGWPQISWERAGDDANEAVARLPGLTTSLLLDLTTSDGDWQVALMPASVGIRRGDPQPPVSIPAVPGRLFAITRTPGDGLFVRMLDVPAPRTDTVVIPAFRDAFSADLRTEVVFVPSDEGLAIVDTTLAPANERPSLPERPARGLAIQVVGIDGLPRAGARITVTDDADARMASPSTVRTVLSDPTGLAAVSRLESPRVAVRIEGIGLRTLDTVLPTTLGPASRARPQLVQLQRGVEVRGRLYWAEGDRSERPASRVSVELRDPGALRPDGRDAVRTTFSDADGRFVFRGLPPGGVYTLFASAERDGATWSVRYSNVVPGDDRYGLTLRNEDPAMPGQQR